MATPIQPDYTNLMKQYLDIVRTYHSGTFNCPNANDFADHCRWIYLNCQGGFYLPATSELNIDDNRIYFQLLCDAKQYNAKFNGIPLQPALTDDEIIAEIWPHHNKG